MKRLIVATATAALASCSSSPPFCGESFCLTEKPTAISKETPGEDFNLYRTEIAGKRFLIYEGNHPNTTGDQDFGSLPRRLEFDPALISKFTGVGDDIQQHLKKPLLIRRKRVLT